MTGPERWAILVFVMNANANDTTNPTDGATVRLPEGTSRSAHNGSKVLASTLLAQIKRASKATKIGLDLSDPASRYHMPDGSWNRTRVAHDAATFLSTVAQRSEDREDGAKMTPWPEEFRSATDRLAIRIALWGGRFARDFKSGTYNAVMGTETIVPVPTGLAGTAIKTRPTPSAVVDTIAKQDAAIALSTYGAGYFGASVRTGKVGFTVRSGDVDDTL